MLVDYTKIRKQKIWDGIVGAIHHSDHMTIGHIYIDEGVQLPMHQHHQEQWSNVLEGIFEFTIGQEVHTMSGGMTVYIPPNVPHSGKAITACKIIDCFHPVREDWKTLPFID
jgi:quercetin dioxygenase-like cupin family protein